MRMFVTALVMAAGIASQADAQQPNYAESQRRSLQAQNSASLFTSQRALSQIVNRAVPRYSFSNVNNNVLKGVTGGSNRQKPFSQVQRGPTVTPYLGLVSDNPFTSSTTNYFSNVRPQLEQQRMNEKLQMQNIQMQRQLQEVAARPPYNPTGSEDRAPTGHAAVYQNNGGVYGNPGGYYPQVPIRSVRGQR